MKHRYQLTKLDLPVPVGSRSSDIGAHVLLESGNDRSRCVAASFWCIVAGRRCGRRSMSVFSCRRLVDRSRNIVEMIAAAAICTNAITFSTVEPMTDTVPIRVCILDSMPVWAPIAFSTPSGLDPVAAIDHCSRNTGEGQARQQGTDRYMRLS